MIDRLEVVILVGLQASGKSTFSRERFPRHAASAATTSLAPAVPGSASGG